jgi:hypothetical protein
MWRRAVIAVSAWGGFVCASALGFGQATTLPSDAVRLYELAAEKCVVDYPSEGVEEYPSHPPFGSAWEEVEKAAWEKNAEARNIARRARSVDTAVWPAKGPYMELRKVANELTDAALYEHIRGHDAEAFEFVLEAWHIAEVQRQDISGSAGLLRAVLAGRCESSVTQTLMTMAPAVRIGNGAADAHAVSTAAIREMISRLLAFGPAETTAQRSMGADWRAKLRKAADESKPIMGIKLTGDEVIDRTLKDVRQPLAERGMAAMSLAAQLFQRENGRWPTDVGELVPRYLPSLVVDPFGDGKQTLRYVVVKGGLPSGADRPLVYSREGLDGVPFYRLDGPQYGFYSGYWSPLPSSKLAHAGQFRDLARWEDVKLANGAATTRPLAVSP